MGEVGELLCEVLVGVFDEMLGRLEIDSVFFISEGLGVGRGENTGFIGLEFVEECIVCLFVTSCNLGVVLKMGLYLSPVGAVITGSAVVVMVDVVVGVGIGCVVVGVGIGCVVVGVVVGVGIGSGIVGVGIDCVVVVCSCVLRWRRAVFSTGV